MKKQSVSLTRLADIKQKKNEMAARHMSDSIAKEDPVIMATKKWTKDLIEGENKELGS